MLAFKDWISRVRRGYKHKHNRKLAAAAIYMSAFNVPGTVFYNLQAIFSWYILVGPDVAYSKFKSTW